jgi:hypothetical protein
MVYSMVSTIILQKSVRVSRRPSEFFTLGATPSLVKLSKTVVNLLVVPLYQVSFIILGGASITETDDSGGGGGGGGGGGTSIWIRVRTKVGGLMRVLSGILASLSKSVSEPELKSAVEKRQEEADPGMEL